jgi:BirA family transcriptional regulator, biotin operon repressor / biotin---[acetyl-CoA-carboxylase] ligase
VNALGRPRLHLRTTTSTNDRARELAQAGAPHGTLVTASEQSAGRGRQGRTWSAPAGQALLMSLVLHRPPPLLPLAAGVAVAEAAGPGARVKWPNDVLIEDRKVAGILAESRPAPPSAAAAGTQPRASPSAGTGWTVLGIGINVAVRLDDLPPELHATAGTLGLRPVDVEPTLERVLAELERVLALEPAALLDAYRARDALRGREITWSGGRGRAAGVDGAGRLVVELPGGERLALDAGEVHLTD